MTHDPSIQRPARPEHAALWNAVCRTDPEHTKEVKTAKGKKMFTAVDAMARIRLATSLWGPYGTAWGVRALAWGMIYVPTESGDRPLEATLDAEFYYPGGAFPISVDHVYEAGIEIRKIMLTDLTTKALSKLGFSADVFLGLFDDDKYVRRMEREFAANPNGAPQPTKPAAAPKPAPASPYAAAKAALEAARGNPAATTSLQSRIEASAHLNADEKEMLYIISQRNLEAMQNEEEKPEPTT